MAGPDLHFATVFEALADTIGDDAALLHDGNQWTWQEFDTAAARFAAFLRSVDAIAIVGDAFARPMLDALDRAEAAGHPYRLEEMRIIMSSGVMWSAEVQIGILRHLDVRLVDSMGSTEGALARRIVERGTATETARFTPLPTTKVLTADGREIAPGSGEAGFLANGGATPLGYYKDEAKTARTFPVIAGHRYGIAGDMATLTADGSVILLGRGSNCINTGGEKVYPEEVEEVIKRHPDVTDCLVVGLADDRFGQRIVAVVSARVGLSPEAVIAHTKGHLSGYKAPRAVVIVPAVERAPNGKADYGWATRTAVEAISGGP